MVQAGKRMGHLNYQQLMQVAKDIKNLQRIEVIRLAQTLKRDYSTETVNALEIAIHTRLSELTLQGK